MKQLDLTCKYNFSQPKIKILEISLLLSRKDILDVLNYESILINGEFFKVPTDQLCDNLKNGKYNKPIIYKLIYEKL